MLLRRYLTLNRLGELASCRISTILWPNAAITSQLGHAAIATRLNLGQTFAFFSTVVKVYQFLVEVYYYLDAEKTVTLLLQLIMCQPQGF